MKNERPKFKVNDVFFSKKHNKNFLIQDVNFVDYLDKGSKSKDPELKDKHQINQWLYDCFYVDGERFVKYYESTLEKNSFKLDQKDITSQILKLLFGTDKGEKYEK